MGGACYKSGAQWASKEVEKALKRAGWALEIPGRTIRQASEANGRASKAVGGHSRE